MYGSKLSRSNIGTSAVKKHVSLRWFAVKRLTDRIDDPTVRASLLSASLLFRLFTIWPPTQISTNVLGVTNRNLFMLLFDWGIIQVAGDLIRNLIVSYYTARAIRSTHSLTINLFFLLCLTVIS